MGRAQTFTEPVDSQRQHGQLDTFVLLWVVGKKVWQEVAVVLF